MKIKNLTLTAFSILVVFSSCVGQNATPSIERINQQLKTGKTTLSEVLSCDSLMYLHSLTPFREMVKANAKPERIQIVTDKEPGTKITVKGYVTDINGKPMEDVLVYFYHTSDIGWYADTASHIQTSNGDYGHARLFGYLKTGKKGEFNIETIKPKGYPNSDLPAHIHIHYWMENNKPLNGPAELLFEDDERLTPKRKALALQDGFLVSTNTGTQQKPVYEYRIRLE